MTTQKDIDALTEQKKKELVGKGERMTYKEIEKNPINAIDKEIAKNPSAKTILPELRKIIINLQNQIKDTKK